MESRGTGSRRCASGKVIEVAYVFSEEKTFRVMENSKKIVFLNIVLVLVCGFMLFQDLTKFYPPPIGRFQWYGDSLTINIIINLSVTVLGCLSIFTQTNMNKSNNGLLLKLINLFYGILINIMGMFFIITSLISIIKYNIESHNLIFMIVLFVVDLLLIYLGILVIIQSLSNSNNKDKLVDESILDTRF